MSKILQMTHADYLAHKAYGSGDIIKMSRSFEYWKWRKENPEPLTRPLVIGGATHLILQAELSKTPDLIKTGVFIYEEGSSLTKGFKAFQAENRGIYCVDVEEFALCKKMVRALLDEPEVMSYLQGAIPEATVIGPYPGTEVLCKCRPDYLHKGRGVSINIKTTTDASESGFIYGAKDWGYDWQSAFYCDILTEQLGQSFDEIHILVEKADGTEPCPIKIFSFGDDTLSWARHQMRQIMERIPECEKSGVWPKNKLILETIELPHHARRIVSL